MKRTIAVVSLLLCLTVIFSSCASSGLSGTYSGNGRITEISFSGRDKVVLKMGNYMDIPMSGTYSIEGDTLSVNVSYTVAGQQEDENFSFSFEQDGDTIILDQQELTKE